MGPRSRWHPRALCEDALFNLRGVFADTPSPRMVLMSPEPVIFHSRKSSFLPGGAGYELLRALGNKRVAVLFQLSWNHDTRWRSDQMVRIVRRINRHPNRNVLILANTQEELRRFEKRGAPCTLVTASATADESLYRPLPGRARRFDAVYDAAFLPYKRHSLASDVEKLSLIAGKRKIIPAYFREIAEVLARAHIYNGDPRSVGHRQLGPVEVNECLNEAGVGLCLSAEEGTMRSSVQYLLAGLPVVSTPSIGGRDLLYDPDYVKIVDPTPEAVSRGVAELIARDLDPNEIRSRTLEKLQPHRDRLVGHLEEICEAQGIPRRFDAPWPEMFGNSLHLPRPLDVAATLETIRVSGANQ